MEKQVEKAESEMGTLSTFKKMFGSFSFSGLLGNVRVFNFLSGEKRITAYNIICESSDEFSFNVSWNYQL